MSNPADTGFKIGDAVYPIPDSEFTLGEAAAIEEISGMTIFEWSEFMESWDSGEGSPPMRVLAALLFVSMHRVDPKVTVKRVMQLTDFEFVLGDAVEDDAGPPVLAESPPSDGSGDSDETPGSTVSGSLGGLTSEASLTGAPV